MGFFLRREVRSGGLKIEQAVRVFLLDDIARCPPGYARHRE